MEPTDAVLAERIAAGDDAAFEQLVHRCSAPLLGMALRMLGDRADAEDVVQDAFLTVWRRAGELVEPAALRTWLFQIARRRCLVVLRSRRTRRTEPVWSVPEQRSVAGGAPLADPERAVEAGAGVIELLRALGDLPPPQRQVWVLAELDGLSYLEIGERIGAGEQAVRGRLFRARTALAEALRAWR
ncbi:sigma-70 family RNA polymerase sigma factor [Saccharopolyspora sp. WRP15-2]|uniref:RNA polymerase sigma factor n=1 Tax=Saccharopolyspora oryzae TaxID=2997343 RepID=A0ABT4V8E3_9PSEU|nr:sigma-70 family RNA polymerase sigma factor [Saccharopolyspora oryzae]MDA3630236.1 sigma-70 family RNA polymerase sigma factor [Saccharopolyspora oryzae]